MMAEVSHENLTEFLPTGNFYQVTLRATPSAGGNSDEYIDTELSEVTSVVGYRVDSDVQVAMNFKKNAKGTGLAEGSSLGYLGFESGSTDPFEVTVTGRP